jgi:two-component system sensor histidine kinase RegB
MWLTFVVSVVMAVWFIVRMTASIRARDAQLAAVREDALRDAQVVALGQLAAGAAHELGTPLATMNVLAGELARDQRLPGDAREDLELLRQQIAACKEIVGGMTRQAGIARAGESQAAETWLEGLLARWRTLWPQATCTFEAMGSGPAPRIAIDPAIEQAVTNLLNNAARVAPRELHLALDWDAARLRITVSDRGPGFPPEILRCCGAKPVQPQGEGAGIGLWLTRAAVQRAGGRLTLDNTATGGRAIIELPLPQGASA